MKRKKTLLSFYTPGILSLIFLPIFCLTYLKKNGDYTNRSCIELTSFIQSDTSYKTFASHEIAKRNFKKIELGVNKQLNDSNLNLANEIIAQMMLAKDTLNGINIHFGDSCVYDYFVKSYNLAIKNKSHIFFHDSDFWFLNIKRPEKNENDLEKEVNLRVNCGTQDAYYEELWRKEEAVRKAKNEEMLKEFSGKYYPIMTSFIFVFIILSYRRISRTR